MAHRGISADQSSRMKSALPHRWDIFCRVIDNYGDIGVSWRLARQLANECGAEVRLWVDDLHSLRALCPEVDASMVAQPVQGVSVFRLGAAADYPPPGEVVIEAFGCGLPQAYVANMADSALMPRWIILEYLSAEPWVREHHGLLSPHPQLGLPRYFFFPGVTPGTGGVPREADLLQQREAFDANTEARRGWWMHHGFDDVAPGSITVSLFAYPHAPWSALLAACAQGGVPVVAAIPAGALAAQVRETFAAYAGNRHRIGNLELRFVPFVPQAGYDALLWASDINFVRGEDSFVRAQWAGRPFVWHIYPQQAGAHEAKLNAFLAAYCEVLPEDAAQAVRGLWTAWNNVTGAPPLAEAWCDFVDARLAQRQGLLAWQEQLLAVGDLTGNLLRFCHGLGDKK